MNARERMGYHEPLLIPYIAPILICSLPRALVLPKLYSNSLLVSLNNRIFVRDGSSGGKARETSGTVSSQTVGSRTFVHGGQRNEFHHIGVAENSIASRSLEASKQVIELMPMGVEDSVDQPHYDYSKV